ncbi:MAG: hypothetical protein RLZ98_1051 [Pseudomonadota bacterium]|jgi:predicted flap endonuclease-1-like 5' DNA nuclease
MTALLWQTALLLLAAYFLGAWIACLIRRTLFWRPREMAPAFEASDPPADVARRPPLPVPAQSRAPAPSSDAPTAPYTPPPSNRFERALVGEPGAAAPAPTDPDVSRRVRAIHAVARAAETERSSEMEIAADPPVVVAEPDPEPKSPQRPSDAGLPTAVAVAAAAAAAVARRANGPEQIVMPVAAGTSGLASVAATIESNQRVDDLENIQGIDASVARLLRRNGASTFERIAGWTAADVDRVETLLGESGRIARQNWIEQAKILAEGGTTTYAEQRAQEVPRRDQSPRPDNSVAPADLPAALHYRDDLTAIDGINDEIQRFLNNQGIYRFSQIAAWKPGALESLEALLGVPGRIERENWIGQARNLSLGHPHQATEISGSSKALVPFVLGAEPVLSEPPPGGHDDLKLIRGIGVLIEKKLNAMGVWHHDQIAAWTASDIERVSQGLDFKDRIEREDWIGQARILSSGGRTEFSDRVSGRS